MYAVWTLPKLGKSLVSISGVKGSEYRAKLRGRRGHPDRAQCREDARMSTEPSQL